MPIFRKKSRIYILQSHEKFIISTDLIPEGKHSISLKKNFIVQASAVSYIHIYFVSVVTKLFTYNLHDTSLAVHKFRLG